MRLEPLVITGSTQKGYDPIEELYECDTCSEQFIPNWSDIDCDACMTVFWNKNPHPLDIAEREFQEEQSFGLEEPSGYGA